MARVVIGNHRLREREPFVTALAIPSARAISIMDVHISGPPTSPDACEHLAPPIHGLLGSVEWPVPIDDAVAGAVVAVELVHLAVLPELGLVHLLGARRAVVVAEYAKQRAAEVLRHLDRRDERLGIELLLAHHHAAAPRGRRRRRRPSAATTFPTWMSVGCGPSFFRPADIFTHCGIDFSYCGIDAIGAGGTYRCVLIGLLLILLQMNIGDSLS
jgi:hypothetical protein